MAPVMARASAAVMCQLDDSPHKLTQASPQLTHARVRVKNTFIHLDDGGTWDPPDPRRSSSVPARARGIGVDFQGEEDEKRQALDGQAYTLMEFIQWYGERRGRDLWVEAALKDSFA